MYKTQEKKIPLQCNLMITPKHKSSEKENNNTITLTHIHTKHKTHQHFDIKSKQWAKKKECNHPYID